MAFAMGIELLTEEQYREIQKLDNFDMKTSRWVQTPSNIRKLGGAIFCDCRFDTDFVFTMEQNLTMLQGVSWRAKGLNVARTAKFKLFENGL